MSLAPLCDKLGHTFHAEGLLQQALTHRSASQHNNERLEFLGDAILNFLIAELLLERFPKLREGDLTRLRARVVSRDSLARVARGISLGSYLILGGGEAKSGGRERDSILADATEAVLGAIYLDSGLEACRTSVLTIFAGSLQDLVSGAQVKDPKTQLQEWLQARGMPLPEYVVVRTEGAAHNQIFTVACQVSALPERVQGSGSSRRAAEQAAACRSLEAIRHG